MESKQSVLLKDTLGGFETYRRVGTFTPRKYWMLFTWEYVAPSRHEWKIVDWNIKPQNDYNTRQR